MKKKKVNLLSQLLFFLLNSHFSKYATAIDAQAKKNVRVLVAGNGPVNFNAMMLIKNTPNVSVSVLSDVKQEHKVNAKESKVND